MMGLEADETNGVDESNADATGGAEEPKTAEQITNLNAALKQSREATKAAQEALAARDAADEEAARKAAEEAGKYEDLYNKEKTEGDAARERLTTLEAKEAVRLEAVTADADAIVAKWPEDDRTLDPTGMDPDGRLRMVRQLDKRLNAETLPHGTRSQGGGDKATIPDWVRANYREYHAGTDAKSDDEYRTWMTYLKGVPRFADKFNNT